MTPELKAAEACSDELLDFLQGNEDVHGYDREYLSHDAIVFMTLREEGELKMVCAWTMVAEGPHKFIKTIAVRSTVTNVQWLKGIAKSFDAIMETVGADGIYVYAMRPALARALSALDFIPSPVITMMKRAVRGQ